MSTMLDIPTSAVEALAKYGGDLGQEEFVQFLNNVFADISDRSHETKTPSSDDVTAFKQAYAATTSLILEAAKHDAAKSDVK